MSLHSAAAVGQGGAEDAERGEIVVKRTKTPVNPGTDRWKWPFDRVAARVANAGLVVQSVHTAIAWAGPAIRQLRQGRSDPGFQQTFPRQTQIRRLEIRELEHAKPWPILTALQSFHNRISLRP